jgi:hypothetical protein
LRALDAGAFLENLFENATGLADGDVNAVI